MGEKANDMTDKELTLKTDTQFIQLNKKKKSNLKKGAEQDFPGGLVSKILHSQCRGHKFNLWLRTEILHAAQYSQKTNKTKTQSHQNKQKKPQTSITDGYLNWFLIQPVKKKNGQSNSLDNFPKKTYKCLRGI